MILYLFLKNLFRIASKVYFRSIQITNEKLVPSNGPLIVVANHPNAFLDPMLIGSILKPRIHFLVKGAMFNNEFLRWLFAKLGMIPIYRRNETADAQDKNVEVFQECYNILNKGKALIIFPEGLSVTERKLRPIKKGPAWIALGAEEAFNYNLNIKILPIGLNYSDPHKMDSDVLVRYGEPILVKDFVESYQKEGKKAVDDLTDVIKSRLEDLTIVIENEQTDKLVADIESIYTSNLKKEYIDKSIIGHSFVVAKDILKAVSFFIKNQPERVEKVKQKIENYIESIDALGLRDTTLKNGIVKRPGLVSFVGSFLFLLLCFPLFLYGLVNNYIAFKLPIVFTKKFFKLEAWHGSMFISLGIFTFIIFYSAQLLLFGSYVTSSWMLLAYAVSLPLSGLFAFDYWKKWNRFINNLKLNSLLKNELSLMAQLIEERKDIIQELELAKEEFLAIRTK